MPATTFLLEVHRLDTRTGLWCPSCLLPAVVEVDVAVVEASSLRVLTRATGSTCTNCGVDGEVTR